MRQSVLFLAAGCLAMARTAQAAPEYLRQAADAVTELELGRANALLVNRESAGPAVAFQRARLALYRGDCDTALAILSSPAFAAIPEAESLREVARGCAQATAAAKIVEDRNVWLRLQDADDEVLVPWLLRVATEARRSLAAELGVVVPSPLRIELVRDLFSLAALSGLPLAAAETTGTVGVARYGRVILVSPRATGLGYPWEDTLAHELTHLAVGRASRDRAPLWLQEGLAKLCEFGWRPPRPFDERRDDDAAARAALGSGQWVDLDQLGPSIALMPTPDRAMAAYAEVASFVDYWLGKSGKPALRLLLMDLRGTGDAGADEALRSVSGRALPVWQAEWQRHLVSEPGVKQPRAEWAQPFPRAQASGVARSVRLGDLLFQRGHYAAAAAELRTAWERAPREASIRWRLSRALLAAGRRDEAVERLGRVEDIAGPHAGWYALSGRFSAEAGDGPQADGRFGVAIALDPLSVDAACEGRWRPAEDAGQSLSMPDDPARRALCAAALGVPHN
jgi:tetratricopeptide (TPR) repeat protein